MWIAISLTQISCTSQLFIERTLPPVVSVSNNQWKVMIMSRYNPDQLPYKREKKVELYADGAMYALAGVVDAIDEDGTYTIVATDTAGYASVGTGSNLTPAQVQETYRQHPHHLLLTLDHFDTFLEQEVVREEDENGDMTKTAHYYLVSKSDWTLYDSTGTVLDRSTLSRDELYNFRGVIISGLLAIGPAISNAGPVINSLARHTGWGYWQRLAPQQISFVRPYYSSKAFAPAAYSMAAGNWSEAIALLKPLTEHNKNKDAGRAAYNMAVVYEAMGSIAEAKHWANVAIGKNNKLALMLLPELNRY